MRGKNIYTLIVAGLLISAGPVLAGEGLISFTYSDLVGSFSGDPGSYLFSAADDGDTDGEVTRLIDPIEDAFFVGAGMLEADFSLSLSVSDPFAAEPLGAGDLTLIDADGDSIVAAVDGKWINMGGSANFVGILTDVFITSDDLTYDGTDGSSFSLDGIPLGEPLWGNVITLSFNEWFSDGVDVTPFSDATTLTCGVIVPEPATLGLLAIGGLAAFIRRRR